MSLAGRARAPAGGILGSQQHGAAGYVRLLEHAELGGANAASKVAAEAACGQARSAGVDVVVARAFQHEGPGRDERFAIGSWQAAPSRSRATRLAAGRPTYRCCAATRRVCGQRPAGSSGFHSRRPSPTRFRPRAKP
jgi:hypothetical protein